MNPEAIALILIGALKGMAMDKAGDLGREVGDLLNDKIEGSKTQIDDEAKDVLKAFLDGLRPELDVDGVDSETAPVA